MYQFFCVPASLLFSFFQLWKVTPKSGTSHTSCCSRHPHPARCDPRIFAGIFHRNMLWTAISSFLPVKYYKRSYILPRKWMLRFASPFVPTCYIKGPKLLLQYSFTTSLTESPQKAWLSVRFLDLSKRRQLSKNVLNQLAWGCQSNEQICAAPTLARLFVHTRCALTGRCSEKAAEAKKYPRG